MALLTAILTHLPSDLVGGQLIYLRSLCPESRFVVCHGGERADFEQLTSDDAIFIEDRTLRGPHFDKSLNETLNAIYESNVRDDPAVDLIYVVEYDHLILSADFEVTLTALAERSGAGLLAKQASARNNSNWSHYLKVRNEARLDRYVAEVSKRDDPTLRWGCLGTGLLFRRDALRAFCELTNAPSYYVEMFVPTMIYHLGFDVVAIDALSDLYVNVRWLPEYSIADAVALKRSGSVFVHPFKRLDALDTIRRTPGPTPVAARAR